MRNALAVGAGSGADAPMPLLRVASSVMGAVDSAAAATDNVPPLGTLATSATGDGASGSAGPSSGPGCRRAVPPPGANSGADAGARSPCGGGRGSAGDGPGRPGGEKLRT